MNVVVTHEKRFQIDKDGNVYTDNENTTGYNFFKRYLDVFDSVTVIGRATNGITTAKTPVTGPGVTFIALPYFWGPIQYLKKTLKIKKSIRSICSESILNSAFIVRGPSVFGGILAKELLRIKYPFAMEVMVDPFDVFSPGSIKHPLRPLFRLIFPIHLRKYCSKASAVSYVTESILQKRYPPPIGGYTTHYSNIRMDSSYLIEKPRIYSEKNRPIKIATVCSLEHLHKGTDTLIDAVARCLDMGIDVRLTIIGDGKLRSCLEGQVEQKGIGNKILFMGRLPFGNSVKLQLDKADIFVLPSKAEGLPRAMIEAMARGLPCLGTTASGIPELLHPDDMVPVGDAVTLAEKITEIYHNPERMNIMSCRNLEKAKVYQEDVLKKRRNDFYSYIKLKTKNHIESKLSY